MSVCARQTAAGPVVPLSKWCVCLWVCAGVCTLFLGIWLSLFESVNSYGRAIISIKVEAELQAGF